MHGSSRSNLDGRLQLLRLALRGVWVCGGVVWVFADRLRGMGGIRRQGSGTAEDRLRNIFLGIRVVVIFGQISTLQIGLGVVGTLLRNYGPCKNIERVQIFTNNYSTNIILQLQFNI